MNSEFGSRKSAKTRGIPCLTCGHTRYRTMSTEPINGSIRRRKTCRACGRRRLTFEKGTR